MKKFIVILLICSMISCFSACSKVCKTCNQTGTIGCSHCTNGSSKSMCFNCAGRAYYECTKCSGAGYIRTDFDCERCSDSKKPGFIYNSGAAIGDLYNGTMNNYNDSKYWLICGNCHEECGKCKGSGNGEKCPDCTEAGKMKCSYCNGDEVVSCPDCN